MLVTPEIKVNRLITVPAALLAFALFCVFCVWHHAPMIQHDIMARTEQSLAANVSTDGLVVDGRDVLLRGPVGSAMVSPQARDIAAKVNGVRVVNVEEITTVASKSSAAAPDAKTVTAKTESQHNIDTVLRNGVVEFQSASALLTPRGRATLNQIVPILAASPALLCEIDGYTDALGDPQRNLALSERRAAASKNYLVGKGIAASRLSTAGYGSAKPIASNDTPAGRQENRRIEFLLKEKP